MLLFFVAASSYLALGELKGGQWGQRGVSHSPADLNPSEGARFCRFGKPPCNHLLDNRFNHYAAQQNLYGFLLHQEYSIELCTMWLVQLHEGRPSYCMIEIPKNFEMAAIMLENFLKELQQMLGCMMVKKPKADLA